VSPVTFIAKRARMNLRNHANYDVCMIGGGFMGAAVALGLVRAGVRTLMVDKSSTIHRASKANFGLIWSQSKGLGDRDYCRLSVKAVLAFKDFVGRLEQASGISTELRLGAGLVLSIGDAELAARKTRIEQFHREAEQCGETHSSRMVDRKEIQDLVGRVHLGERVSGGSFSDIDGDVNPLLLLRAMRKVFIESGGHFHHGCAVHAIQKGRRTYIVNTTEGTVEVPRIVLAAGLGNIELASMMGKTVPLVPEKGQLLVTERISPFLSFPMSGLRQTGNGSVMIGYTNEKTGFEVSTTPYAAAHLAKRALQIFPCLEHVKVVRSWGGLRVLTRDNAPIYDEIDENAFILATHSCVTLASVHESLLPPWILGGPRPDEIRRFDLGRFDV
jgi:glycine/D-amino acid oxidase-like deaminating enzyme